MTEQRQQLRMQMQEALDGLLPPEQLQRLDALLDADPDEFAAYNRLQRVDQMLRSAPHERAPKRLAATIMARLSQSLEAEGQREQFGVPNEMIGVAMTLVTVVTMPLLVGACWLIVHAAASPELLEAVFQQIIATLLLVIEILKVFLEKAQGLVAEDPAAAVALLALIPATLVAIARYVLTDEE
jgi:anti-sigma factor RsiW